MEGSARQQTVPVPPKNDTRARSRSSIAYTSHMGHNSGAGRAITRDIATHGMARGAVSKQEGYMNKVGLQGGRDRVAYHFMVLSKLAAKSQENPTWGRACPGAASNARGRGRATEEEGVRGEGGSQLRDV